MKVKEYYSLYEYLRSQNYNYSEAIFMIKKLRNLDAEVFAMFKLWLVEKQTPDFTINDVSFSDLIKKEEMSPVEAFLMIDWIKKEPVEAMKYMAFHRYRIDIQPITEEEACLLRKAANELETEPSDYALNNTMPSLDEPQGEFSLENLIEDTSDAINNNGH